MQASGSGRHDDSFVVPAADGLARQAADSSDGASVLRQQRQGNLDAKPLPALARSGAHVAVVQVDDFANDGEAEAGAVVVATSPRG